MPNSEVLLTRVRERINYEEFYREYLPTLTRPSQNGEARARCIFHDDANPSLSVNVRTGMYICRVPTCDAAGGGDFVSFHRRRTGATFPQAVEYFTQRYNITEPLPPSPVTFDEEAILAAYRPPAVLPPIDPVIVESAHERLLNEPLLMDFLLDRRGINRETVELFKIGHDGQRYYIPVYDSNGTLVNIRRYKPNTTNGDKMLSWRAGYGSARLFPGEAFDGNGRLFLFEGELDAILATQYGLCAISSTAGAGTWRDEWNELFRARDVVVCYDHDDAGRGGALNVARSLHGIAQRIVTVQVDLMEPRGADFTDYIVGGRTIEDFLALVDAAPPFQPPPTPEPPVANDDAARRYTDMGNAQRLRTRHGANLRFAANRWYAWDGSRFAIDDTLDVERRAKETVRAIRDETVEEAELPRLKRHAQLSESSARVNAMITLARSELPIAARLNEFDTDPWLLNCINGTVDLRTGTLRAHRREDLITKRAEVPYDPDATCPLWLNFINRIFANHAELISFVQRAAGYSMTGDPQEQVLFFLYGLGRNGKSTFIEVVRKILGDYATAADFSTLATQRGDGPRNDIARLRGSRVVSASEFGAGRALDEAVIKQLTGGDTIAARRLYAESEEFRPTHTLFIAANHKPVIRGTDEGIWRRILLIPFTVTIPLEERDPDLREKLFLEAPGILAWMVRGCLLWQEGGLRAPEEVLSATSDYRSEMDTVEPFLEARCVIEAGASERATDLYTAYKAWADQAGEQPISQTAFGLRLTEKNFVSRRGRGARTRVRVGLRLIRDMLTDAPLQVVANEDGDSPPW